MTSGSDILVIGGGMAGISAAAYMAKECSVTVLEAESSIGYHSSGRTAAIFIRNYGNEVLRAINALSEPILTEPDGISDHSLLSPRGQLMIANEEEVPNLEEYLRGATGMERISASDAVKMFPILNEDTIAAAAFEKQAQDIDVDRMLQGYAKLLRKNQGKLISDAKVTAISFEKGRWLVETTAGNYEAKILVNAAGAWVDQIAELAGVKKIGATPLRRSAVLLPAPAYDNFDAWPLVVSASEEWYAKPEAGKLMISPADEDPVEPHDAWPEDMVLAEGLYRFQQAANLPDLRPEHSWAGLRTFVADRTPVVGFAPDAENFLWLAGQGGYGIQTAPALAGLAANYCLGQTSLFPDEISTALKPDRLFS